MLSPTHHMHLLLTALDALRAGKAFGSEPATVQQRVLIALWAEGQEILPHSYLTVDYGRLLSEAVELDKRLTERGM